MPGETDLEAARRLAVALDHTTLAIQGPPGSGKTYTGARMICSLLDGRQAGRDHRNSHKVIGNLLDGGARGVANPKVSTSASVQKAEQGADPRRYSRVARQGRGRCARRGSDDGRANLAAGTSWLWASAKMTEAVDVLFVDEAGQISLANVDRDVARDREPRPARRPAAARPAAQGHPSTRAPTVPRWPTCSGARHDAADRGLFLERTWRLHPDLCDFTSEVFYDDRLEPEATLVVQRVIAPGARSPTARDRACSTSRPSAPTTSPRSRPARSRSCPDASSRAAARG